MILNTNEKINFFNNTLSELETTCKNNIKILMELIADNKLDEINQLYNTIKHARYSGQGYIEEYNTDETNSKNFYIGYCYATIDAMQLYADKLRSDQEIMKIRTKYRDQILKILARHQNMFHKDLAGSLNISASALNAVIKQMNATSVKLININEISKYKIYSLTPAARHYVQKHKLILENNTRSRHDINIETSITYSVREQEPAKDLQSFNFYYSSATNLKNSMGGQAPQVIDFPKKKKSTSRMTNQFLSIYSEQVEPQKIS